MKGKVIKIVLLCMLLSMIGCSSTKFYEKLETNPENIMRGSDTEGIKVRKYLEEVLESPQGREIKVYKRNAFSADNKQNFLIYHIFYVFLKDGKLEHTLVFTATPEGSKHNGTWMLDADSDVRTYYLYLYDDNNWDMKEVLGKNNEKVNLVKTTENIIKRLDKGYKFGATANVRGLPWYHQTWMFILGPPPVLGYLGAVIYSVNGDNCISAVLETVEWEEDENI